MSASNTASEPDVSLGAAAVSAFAEAGSFVAPFSCGEVSLAPVFSSLCFCSMISIACYLDSFKLHQLHNLHLHPLHSWRIYTITHLLLLMQVVSTAFFFDQLFQVPLSALMCFSPHQFL